MLTKASEWHSIEILALKNCNLELSNRDLTNTLRHESLWLQITKPFEPLSLKGERELL